MPKEKLASCSPAINYVDELVSCSWLLPDRETISRMVLRILPGETRVVKLEYKTVFNVSRGQYEVTDPGISRIDAANLSLALRVRVFSFRGFLWVCWLILLDKHQLNAFSQNPWLVGRDFKDRLVPLPWHPCHKQEHLPLDQGAQGQETLPGKCLGPGWMGPLEYVSILESIREIKM